jgi:poly-gamma-glutamate synthesis protein (capsule biosynthesis protein)
MRAVGDVMFARGIERQLLGEAGMASLLSPMRTMLRAPDITFANLETTLATGGNYQRRLIHLRSHPNAAFALTDAGFDIVSVANNHVEDWGAIALESTLHVLDNSGIQAVGAAPPGEEWPSRVVVRRRGVDVAFLAFTVFRTASTHWVDDDPLGLAVVSAQVGAASLAADLVVTSFHWGAEYQVEPTQRQQNLARAAVDAGADLVLGHHPHRLQGIAVYRGKAIVYSLGNFLFDQPWQHTRDTMLVDWRAGTNAIRQTLRIYPVEITRKPFAPERLLGVAARQRLAAMEELCGALGTETRLDRATLEILGLGEAQPAGATVVRAGH